jgi:predicted nucleotidyltransferase
MDLGRPYATICPTLDGEILVTLGGTTRPLTGRELARLVRHGSQSGVNKALQRLVDHGIVLRQEAGRAMLYSLNREHLAAPAVETLSGIRTELIQRLSSAFETWKLRPVHASLFGSAARGDGDTESDIDLFVIRPSAAERQEGVWHRQLDDLARKVHRWTGNQAGISEVGEAEVARLRRTKPKVVEALKDDAVTLFGKPIIALVGGRQ